MLGKLRRFLCFRWLSKRKKEDGNALNNDEAQEIDIDMESSVPTSQVAVRSEQEEKRTHLMAVDNISSSIKGVRDATAMPSPKVALEKLGHAVLMNSEKEYFFIYLYIPLRLETIHDENHLFCSVYDAMDLAADSQCGSINFKKLSQHFGDSEKVLSIVNAAVTRFFQENPLTSLKTYLDGALVFSENKTPSRGQAEKTDESSLPVGGASSTAIINSDFSNSKQRDRWIQGKKADIRIVDGRYVVGEPSGTFSQIPSIAKQFGKNQHREDISADIAQVDDILVLAASFRGAMHYATSKVRQDSFAIGSEESVTGTKWIIAAIADGVSEASQSHFLADFLTQQTVVFVRDVFDGKSVKIIKDVDWGGVAKKLVQASQDCCERLSQGKASSLKQYLPRWASTLEFVVVELDKSGEKNFVSVTVAGDGAAYVLSGEKGWKTIKIGKIRKGNIASNAVTALPIDPGAPIINFGVLDKDEHLFITTDGLSDMIGNGNTVLGGFFQREFSKCKNIISFLRIMDVSMYQADDDRTGILIKENQI